MTTDPDELLYEQEISKGDPARAIAAIEEIEIQLRYGLPTLKFLGWAIVVLLALILWRVW
jgi:hypothetical protein